MAESNTSPARFNVALIGYGLSTTVFQIPFIPLVPEFNLYAILQRTPKVNCDAAKDYPDVRVRRTYEEVIGDPAVHLVVIGTATHTHFTLCKQAIQAGKHVLCEKPFTLTTAEADELISLASRAGLLLSVFHNRRWDADFLTVKPLIEKGTLGRIVEFQSHWDVHSPRPRAGWETTWRTRTGTGCGAVYDLGAHLIDQALQLFGQPQEVTGFLYSQRENGVEQGDADSMTVILRFASGVFVTLKASIFNVEVEKLRFWVRGTRGTFKKCHLDVQEQQIVDKQALPADAGFGVEAPEYHGVLITEDEEGRPHVQTVPTASPPTYLAFYNQLAAALAKKGDLPVTPESAREVVQVIELAIESARQKRTLAVAKSS